MITAESPYQAAFYFAESDEPLHYGENGIYIILPFRVDSENSYHHFLNTQLKIDTLENHLQGLPVWLVAKKFHEALDYFNHGYKPGRGFVNRFGLMYYHDEEKSPVHYMILEELMNGSIPSEKKVEKWKLTEALS